MIRPTLKIIPLLILGSVVVLSVLYVIIPSRKLHNYISVHCPTYKPYGGFVDTAEFIDCVGVIGIEKFDDENELVVFNGLFPEEKQWDSFRIRNYIIYDNQIFYIEDPVLNTGHWTYLSFTKSKDKNISLYRKVDGSTAKFTLYKTLDEAPPDDRAIFEKLLTKK